MPLTRAATVVWTVGSNVPLSIRRLVKSRSTRLPMTTGVPTARETVSAFFSLLPHETARSPATTEIVQKSIFFIVYCSLINNSSKFSFIGCSASSFVQCAESGTMAPVAKSSLTRAISER